MIKLPSGGCRTSPAAGNLAGSLERCGNVAETLVVALCAVQGAPSLPEIRRRRVSKSIEGKRRSLGGNRRQQASGRIVRIYQLG